MARQFANAKDRQKVRVEWRRDNVPVKKAADADTVFIYGSDGRVIFSGSPDDFDDLETFFGGGAA